MKEGEKISQRTYMKDPGTWTMVKGLFMEVEVGWVEGAKEEKWDNCNSINNKIYIKKNKLIMEQSSYYRNFRYRAMFPHFSCHLFPICCSVDVASYLYLPGPYPRTGITPTIQTERFICKELLTLGSRDWDNEAGSASLGKKLQSGFS